MPFVRRKRVTGRRFIRKKRIPMSRLPKPVRSVVKANYPNALQVFLLTGANVNVTSTLAIAHLSAIPQHVDAVGSSPTYADRFGMVVKPVHLDMNILLKPNSAGNSCGVRVFLMQGTTASGTIPTSGQIFEDATSATSALLSPFNQDHVQRYPSVGRRPIKILKQKHFYLPGGTIEGAKSFAWRWRLNKMGTISFNGPLGTAYTENPVYIAFISDIAVNVPTISYSSALYFHGGS